MPSAFTPFGKITATAIFSMWAVFNREPVFIMGDGIGIGTGAAVPACFVQVIKNKNNAPNKVAIQCIVLFI